MGTASADSLLLRLLSRAARNRPERRGAFLQMLATFIIESRTNPHIHRGCGTAVRVGRVCIFASGGPRPERTCAQRLTGARHG